MKRALGFCSVVWILFVADRPCLAEDQKGTAMTQRIQTLEAKLSAFRNSNDFASLNALVGELPALEAAATEKEKPLQMRLDWLLRALGAVEQKIDKSFDPRDAPERNVAPPSSKYSPGVAPESIKEENIRREYEAALAANRAKADAYQLQMRLRRSKDYLLEQTSRFLSDKERASFLPELTNQFSRYYIDPESQTRILSAFKPKE